MTMIFVNLPTSDLERSKAFYQALGCTINPLFTDENGACVVWDEKIYFMMLTREFFATFTGKEVVDPATSAQAMISFAQESREAVDELIAKGVAAGGTELREPQDYGFMYSRDLADPDGNELGFLYMLAEAAEKGPEAYMAEHGDAAATS